MGEREFGQANYIVKMSLNNPQHNLKSSDRFASMLWLVIVSGMPGSVGNKWLSMRVVSRIRRASMMFFGMLME